MLFINGEQIRLSPPKKRRRIADHIMMYTIFASELSINTTEFFGKAKLRVPVAKSRTRLVLQLEKDRTFYQDLPTSSFPSSLAKSIRVGNQNEHRHFDVR